MIRVLLLAVTACVSTAMPSRAQEGSDLFDPAKISLDRAAMSAIAADLVEYAKAQAKAVPDYHLIGHYRKLVRVAYQLSASDPAVAAAHARIRGGLAPDAPKREVARPSLMKALLELVGKAKAGKSRDDQSAARYLCAVGLLIDPQDEACLVEADKLIKRGAEPSWDTALAVYRRVVADGATCSINGLVVMKAGGTAEVGSVSRIVLTYRASVSPVLDVQLLREAAGQIQTSMEEATRYWDRMRKQIQLPGGTLEISFEDKFSKKDGPSAGAAYAVLLRSFSDPFQTDPLFAMTGDVSVDGRILQVGGIFPKIRGAVMGGCARVGVPLVNELELVDGVVINGPATLAEIEIYGMETVADAIALARSDRPERDRQVSVEFAGLKPLVEKKLKANDPATTAAIEKLTASILASTPRHLSAKLIAAWNSRKLPATLTLGASLDQPFDILDSYLIAIRTEDKPKLEDIGDETKTVNIAEVIRKLRELGPKLHTDAQKPAAKLDQCCQGIQKFIQARAGVDSKEKRIEELDKTIADLKKRIDRARDERKAQELINALIDRHNEVVAEHNGAVGKYKKAVEERKQMFGKVVDLWNDYIVMVRTLTQDPKLLEKLQTGK